MTDEIVAAGGWCAPSDLLYSNRPAFDVRNHFPEIKVARGGIRYDAIPAPDPEGDAIRAMIARRRDDFAKVRRLTIDHACLIGMSNGWDIHITEPPTVYNERWEPDKVLMYLRCIGIEFVPSEYAVPTLVFHAAPQMWEDLWDED
jgi:hypothetical protein